MDFYYQEKAVKGFSLQLEVIELSWWFYLVTGLVSIGLAHNFLRKSQKEVTRLNYFFSLSYASAVSYIVILFTVILTGAVVKQISHEFSLPKYSAKVIDSSYRVGVREKNMGVSEYSPLVGFADKNNRIINIPLNMASEERFSEGSYVKVGYKEGMNYAYAFNPKRYIIYFGEMVFLAVFYSGLLFILGYGLRNQYLKDKAALFATIIFGYLIIPGMMVFMALLMTKALLGKLAGSSDLSWGGFLVCLFFVIILVFSIYGYFMFIFKSTPADLSGKVKSKKKPAKS
ncbi:hypothetical protein A4C53_RS02165 [Elizabethkingia anophelis]|uniref:hypothetical protein n=1 Tax=Elizabethkingia anophelis TaxID=1117645 RepID=UPI00077E686B|nr:hypothetical protein [Elizabethkingia anophelis]AMR40577.1 hypothetical protein A2T74_03995 [Elizabethkingia anophelis]AMX47213.1 hypothetical protein A4C56_03995 [Elizabethkingia anophelis]AMX50674.1 hypothetical protein A2T72_03995 [Elizabethkingia anophelis]AMX54065.1 hypothetical protein A2T59_03995 [Elizabethkingia anophelis]EGT4345766.1 hypothetical protein [Elizabethkingia anophelis]